MVFEFLTVEILSDFIKTYFETAVKWESYSVNMNLSR